MYTYVGFCEINVKLWFLAMHEVKEKASSLLIIVTLILYSWPYYGVSETVMELLSMFRFVCHSLFAVEMGIVGFGLTLKQFTDDWFNFVNMILLLTCIPSMVRFYSFLVFIFINLYTLLSCFTQIKVCMIIN